MIRKIGEIGVLLFAVLLTAVCTSAQAVSLTNGATTIAYDGFEGYFAGYNPPPSPWVSGIAAGATPTAGGIVGPPASPPHDGTPVPSAFEGEKYLHLHRLGTIPSESLPFASQTSGTVKLTFMANTGSTGVYGAFKILDAASGNGFQVGMQGHATYLGGAGVYAWGPGLVNLGLGWTDEVWKKVEFEYTIGSSAATLKVDGGAAVPFNSTTGGPISSLDRLDYFVPSTYDSEINIDAVPEPATMVLLSLGGLGILRRRKA